MSNYTKSTSNAFKHLSTILYNSGDTTENISNSFKEAILAAQQFEDEMAKIEKITYETAPLIEEMMDKAIHMAEEYGITTIEALHRVVEESQK